MERVKTDNNGLWNKPKCIWNCDGTGLGTDPGSNEVIVKRGVCKAKLLTGSALCQNLIILECENANGDWAWSPSMVLFKGKNLLISYTIGGPEDALYGMTKNGWMLEKSFFSVIHTYVVLSLSAQKGKTPHSQLFRSARNFIRSARCIQRLICIKSIHTDNQRGWVMRGYCHARLFFRAERTFLADQKFFRAFSTQNENWFYMFLPPEWVKMCILTRFRTSKSQNRRLRMAMPFNIYYDKAETIPYPGWSLLRRNQMAGFFPLRNIPIELIFNGLQKPERKSTCNAQFSLLYFYLSQYAQPPMVYGDGTR
uniref:Uncharacterized protein n=1 Tax=Romanomermis culicivorax TaxID=13658 RepID=A0A915K980_ROMCU